MAAASDDGKHIVVFHTMHIILCDLQLTDKGRILLDQLLRKKHFCRYRHQWARRDPVPEPPLAVRIEEGCKNLHAGLFHRITLIRQLDEGQRIKMLHIAPVGIFCLLLMGEILEIHVHGNLILVHIDAGKDIEGRTDQLSDSSIEIVAVETVHVLKKGRDDFPL